MGVTNVCLVSELADHRERVQEDLLGENLAGLAVEPLADLLVDLLLPGRVADLAAGSAVVVAVAAAVAANAVVGVQMLLLGAHVRMQVSQDLGLYESLV